MLTPEPCGLGLAIGLTLALAAGAMRATGALAATPCPPTPTPDPARAAREAAERGATTTPVGHAENALGTLVVQHADGRMEQVRGRESVALFEGDECRTEKGSKAFIRLADGTKLAMNEETTFTLLARQEPEGRLVRVLKLALGELWLKTAGSPAMEIQTPAAVAAIRGTELDLRVGADGKSVLTVLQGVVVLKNESCSPCTVDAATRSVVEPGRPCEPPTAVDPASATAWLAGVAP